MESTRDQGGWKGNVFTVCTPIFQTLWDWPACPACRWGFGTPTLASSALAQPPAPSSKQIISPAGASSIRAMASWEPCQKWRPSSYPLVLTLLFVSYHPSSSIACCSALKRQLPPAGHSPLPLPPAPGLLPGLGAASFSSSLQASPISGQALAHCPYLFQPPGCLCRKV